MSLVVYQAGVLIRRAVDASATRTQVALKGYRAPPSNLRPVPAPSIAVITFNEFQAGSGATYNADIFIVKIPNSLPLNVEPKINLNIRY